jgi:hypothetical protein
MSTFDEDMENLMSLLMSTSWQADKTKGLLWRLTRALPPPAPANDRRAVDKSEKP